MPRVGLQVVDARQLWAGQDGSGCRLLDQLPSFPPQGERDRSARRRVPDSRSEILVPCGMDLDLPPDRERLLAQARHSAGVFRAPIGPQATQLGITPKSSSNINTEPSIILLGLVLFLEVIKFWFFTKKILHHDKSKNPVDRIFFAEHFLNED